MKKIITLSTFTLGLVLMLQPFITFTNSFQPLAGNTGSPADNGRTCATTPGCHTGASTINGSLISLQSLTSTNLSNGYASSTVYNIAVNLSAFNNNKNGFSLSVLNNTNTQAGKLEAVGTSTALDSLNGIYYISHKNNTSGTVSWNFKWTSPATSVGQVKFYIAANKANNDADTTGDAIGTAIYSVSPSAGLAFVSGSSGGTGIEVLSADENGIDIFPNPISNRISFSYSVEGNKNVSAALYNLNGQMIQEFFNEEKNAGEHNESFNINSEMAMGLYLVQVRMDDKVFFKKVMVN
jgi:hypothetical protein